MSKGMSYMFRGTKGDIINVASNLPPNGKGLIRQGWEDVSHPRQAATGHYTYKDPDTGLKIRYDAPKEGASGFRGKGHFHILNPSATGPKNLYLDKDGNPVAKNSPASHLLPKGD